MSNGSSGNVITFSASTAAAAGKLTEFNNTKQNRNRTSLVSIAFYV